LTASRGVRPVQWLGDRIRVLDQTALPAAERYLDLRDPQEVARAIRRLVVRGAPLLGIVAGYGMALAAERSADNGTAALRRDLRRAGERLIRSRPTAVNVGWAVRRVLDAAEAVAGDGPESVRRAVVAEAMAIHGEDEAACRAIGRFGAELIPSGAGVMTHCNTGSLATGGIGTAQGVIVTCHRAGKRIHVWVNETRPVLQGARLTAWELKRLGIPLTLIADGAAATFMAGGAVDAVVVGADRIAANGDVANKVGTYTLAVLARHHGVPFYVAAPASTIDRDTPTGAEVVIERRNPTEVTEPLGVRIAPEGTWAVNPAFDITPARLITAIITDRGVVRRPFRAGLRLALARDPASSAGRVRAAAR
jgi:methylthioribose-1-phosphate isomerase